MLGHAVDRRLSERFRAKVRVADTGCWLWTGALSSNGYGSVGIGGCIRSTHRVSYETLVGPIPDDLQIDHLCEVRACCNPAHLEPVSAAENTRRSRAKLTVCAQGHPLSGDNLAWHGTRQTRICIACRREANRRYRQRATSLQAAA